MKSAGRHSLGLFRWVSRLVVAVCGAALVSPALAAAADYSTAAASAKAYIERLAEADAPGCAVGAYAIDSNRWVFLDAFGLANLETGRAITPGAIFGVASVTKQFTAAATAIAAVEGRLSLDDEVRRHIPEMPEYGAAMTIRDLIGHTNGLRDIGRLTMLTGRPQDYVSQDARVQLLLRQRALNFTPGEDYRYGNSGYLLLAEIIERVTGESFPDYVDRAIFQPMKMTHSYFGTATRGDVDRALPYSPVDDAWRNDDPFPLGDGEWGHQGLMTTVEDYAKWLSNLYSDESKLAGGAVLLATLRSQLGKRDGSLVPYGFGFRFETYKSLATIGHGGSGLGYKAHTMIFPERRMAILAFCNHGRYAQPMVMRLADIILDLGSDEASALEAAHFALSPKALAKFSGAYREPALRLPMFVEAVENGLLVTGDVAPSLFRPIAANRFRNEQYLEIAFEMDVNGRAEALIQSGRRKYGTGRFERIDRAVPSPDALLQYAGDYYSDELEAIYRLTVADGKLTARILGGDGYSISPFTFDSMLEHEFVSPDSRLAIRFQDDEEGRPVELALTYQFGWITDVRFKLIDHTDHK